MNIRYRPELDTEWHDSVVGAAASSALAFNFNFGFNFNLGERYAEQIVEGRLSHRALLLEGFYVSKLTDTLS